MFSKSSLVLTDSSAFQNPPHRLSAYRYKQAGDKVGISRNETTPIATYFQPPRRYRVSPARLITWAKTQ